MPKRQRGGGGSRHDAASTSSSSPAAGSFDSSLRNILSLPMPRCSACGTGWFSERSELLPMPPCSCGTTLAIPSDFPLPSLPDNREASNDGSGGNDKNNERGGVGAASAAASASATALLSAIRCPHRLSPPVTRTWDRTATCRPCLVQWSRCSDDVEQYDYRDPRQIRPGYTVEVKCPVCKVRYRKRTIAELLSGRGRSPDGWDDAVEQTIRAVRWSKKVRRRVRKLGAGAPRSPSDKDGGDAEEEKEAEAEARRALGSLLRDGDGPACGHSSDECFSDSDDEAVGVGARGAAPALALASPGYAHHQMAAPGEIRDELCRRDPKFRQEDEDARLLREKLQTAEGRAELGLAGEDALVASREGAEVEGLARRARSEEEEKRDAELARSIMEGEEKEERLKRRRREVEDERIARELQKKFEQNLEKELRKPAVKKKSKRSSPFDDGRDSTDKTRTGASPSATKVAGARSAGKRRRSCACDGCRREGNCGECINCLDKPQFGGPNKRKQKCQLRHCSAAASAGPAAIAATSAPAACATPATLSCIRSSSVHSAKRNALDDEEKKKPESTIAAKCKSEIPSTVVAHESYKENSSLKAPVADSASNNNARNDQQGLFAAEPAGVKVFDIRSDDDSDQEHRSLSSPLPESSAASSCSGRYVQDASSAPVSQSTDLNLPFPATTSHVKPQCPSPRPVKQSRKHSRRSSPSPTCSTSSSTSRRSASSGRPVSNGAKGTRGKASEEKLKELVAMGFPIETSRQCYLDSDGDMEVAIAMLLSSADY